MKSTTILIAVILATLGPISLDMDLHRGEPAIPIPIFQLIEAG